MKSIGRILIPRLRLGRLSRGWRWRAKINYPIESGMTPTAGGLVFLATWEAILRPDGHGRKLWGEKIGAVGGGVIT
jgi:alcohol dehydrogenase (cytochrome c)